MNHLDFSPAKTTSEYSLTQQVDAHSCEGGSKHPGVSNFSDVKAYSMKTIT